MPENIFNYHYSVINQHPDPERQAAFEKAVAQMPLEHDTLSQALKESVLNAISQILFRVTLRWPL